MIAPNQRDSRKWCNKNGVRWTRVLHERFVTFEWYYGGAAYDFREEGHKPCHNGL